MKNISEEQELDNLYREITNPTKLWKTQGEFWKEFSTVKNTVSLKTVNQLIEQCLEKEWYETVSKLKSLKALILDLSNILTGYNDLFHKLDLNIHKILLDEDDHTVSKISKGISHSTSVFKLLSESDKI